AKNNKLLGQIANAINNFREIDKIILVNFNNPQPRIAKAIQQGLDQRGLPCTAASPQQGIIGRLSREKQSSIGHQSVLLGIDTQKAVEVDGIQAAHRPQPRRFGSPDRRQHIVPVNNLHHQTPSNVNLWEYSRKCNANGIMSVKRVHSDWKLFYRRRAMAKGSDAKNTSGHRSG